MANRLIVIGWMGIRRCYLNVERDEAIRRFKAHEGYHEGEDMEKLGRIDEFEFNDEFGCYDAWSI